ncbi:cyclic pyranopterin monophosphate synthase MoaC [Reichenbachiella versicolor]|uniref:cyclic pyranopterin monophosphate synthase MoaC n=1 Tax=Reichenbachiella versicolor TaxID=1821036 RepID=UPI000D6DDE29|nr:cyclic pyranopterin monophosphate synthase MoaC [Reichenbachiella versicolor]
MENELTHIKSDNTPGMVDVSPKKVTLRTACAKSIVLVSEEIAAQFTGDDIISKKGPVFQTAIIAGTMGAKKTGELIPLCHPIGLESCDFEIELKGTEIHIKCTCTVQSKTGVEMEALTGASTAALTIYDMCKAMSHGIIIKETKLISKTGGKKDYHLNE